MSNINLANLGDYVGEKLLNTITSILEDLIDVYGLESFDSTFIVQFAIHIFSMLQRIQLNVHVHHALVNQFKNEHAGL